MSARKKLIGTAAIALAAGGSGLGLAGTAHAAGTIAAKAVAYGTGSVAGWDGNAVQLDPSSASGASAQLDLVKPPAASATVAPTMTASSAKAGDPRWVIEFHNGNTLDGALPAGSNESALTWTVNNAGTYASYAAAYAKAAPAGSDDQVTAAFIVDDAGYAGVAVTVSDITYNGEAVVPYAPPAYLYGGHVVPGSLLPTRAEIGWRDGPGVHYVLSRTFGYGFSFNGSPHLGFTGITTGYWEGLAPGHTYDIELIPANADRQELPNARVGWITIVTP